MLHIGVVPKKLGGRVAVARYIAGRVGLSGQISHCANACDARASALPDALALTLLSSVSECWSIS